MHIPANRAHAQARKQCKVMSGFISAPQTWTEPGATPPITAASSVFPWGLPSSVYLHKSRIRITNNSVFKLTSHPQLKKTSPPRLKSSSHAADFKSFLIICHQTKKLRPTSDHRLEIIRKIDLCQRGQAVCTPTGFILMRI